MLRLLQVHKRFMGIMVPIGRLKEGAVITIKKKYIITKEEVIDSGYGFTGRRILADPLDHILDIDEEEKKISFYAMPGDEFEYLGNIEELREDNKLRKTRKKMEKELEEGSSFSEDSFGPF